MTIECPVCGKEIAFSQYCFEEEMCYSCLSIQENEESDNEESD